MEILFLKLLNMSITASWLVLVVVVIRLLLKKAPRAFIVVLWAFVGIRLICPFSFDSVFSLIPSAETIPQDIFYSASPEIQSGVPVLNSVANPVITGLFSPEPMASVNPVQILAFAASIVWIVGMAAMVLYAIISYFSIYRKVREAAPLRDNIFLCDAISTPFILGIIRPRIYLPSDMREQDMEYVIAHEKAHLKRRDHWWKPLGFLLLTVYWFNPVMWLAYVLLCKDIEFACDEKVLRNMGAESKKPYAHALINCSIPRKRIAACPLAFGEVGVKGRIQSVLNYKKPAFWILFVAVISCIAVAVCFLTNPKRREGDLKTFIENEFASHPQLAYISEDVLRFGYKDSVDPVTPEILLKGDGTCQFTYSLLSSYLAIGTYELTEDTLTMKTYDGANIYLFEIQGYNFVFDASSSSEIPEYRYSGDSDETTCPVPDGAVFELISSEG